jgi:hypothetical protein
MLEGITYAQQSFTRAWEKGYIWQSIKTHAGHDFVQVAGGAIAGAIGGLALVFVGQVGGAAAGSALGAYVSAGNPAAAIAMGQVGAAIGRTIAVGALQLLGIAFLVEYVGQRIVECTPYVIAAYDLTMNQAPVFLGQTLEFTIDMAARMMAEAVGVLCGLILAALVIWVGVRVARSKSAENYKELTESKFNQLSHGLVMWLVPRLSELRMRTMARGRAGLRVIEGGLPSSALTPLQNALRVAKGILPKVVSASTNTMTVKSVQQLHGTLTNDGFRLVKAEPYGPQGGYQLFYQKGNVVVRFKTAGDSGGPRAGQAHMSAGYNDGRGLDWHNDLGKFTANGKVEAKVVADPARFSPTDFQGNPQKMVLLPANYRTGDVDAWAGRTHFSAPNGFSLTGLDAIVRSAAP